MAKIPTLIIALAASFQLQAATELYITAGQSNMAGLGGKAEPRHLLPNPHISFRNPSPWNKYGSEWHPCIGTAPADLGVSGVGPWWSFAQVMADAKPQSEIRILALAVSGSPLMEWVKGGKHYETSIPAIREAIAQGMELKGIIWHQGEAGTGLKYGEKPDYEEMFAQMINDFRTGLDRPDLPFVAGSLGETGEGGAVNTILIKYQGKIPNYACAITKNRTLADNVHYDAPSCEALGIEMARQMLTLEKLPAPSFLPAILTSKSQPAWSLPAGAHEIIVNGDSSSQQNTPSINLGNTPRLYLLAGNNIRTTYLQFTDLPENLKKATLNLNARAVPGASATITAIRLSSGFDEKTLTFSNAPAMSDSKVDATISIPEGIVTIDVTRLLVAGEKNLALALTTNLTNNPLIFDSREGDWAPRLVIE